MSRPSQIRRVVAELRAVLGPEYPFRDLLRLAAIIVRAHREPEVLDEGGYVRSAFFAIEVDLALQDGGWKVLDFERRGGMSFDES